MDRTICLFIQIRTIRFVIVVALVCVGKMQISCAENLKTVAEVCIRGEYLRAEARAWVVHLEQQDRLAGVVADGRLYMS